MFGRLLLLVLCAVVIYLFLSLGRFRLSVKNRIVFTVLGVVALLLLVLVFSFVFSMVVIIFAIGAVFALILSLWFRLLPPKAI